MGQVFSRKDLKQKRRELRNNMPNAEVVLWSKLKGRQLVGLKFRRQHSIEKYVMDLCCPEVRHAIEVDGPSHYEREAEAADETRQKIIESYGIRVLRFTNTQVYENLEEVWLTIERTAADLMLLRGTCRPSRRSACSTPLNPPLERGESQPPLGPPLEGGE